MSEQLSTLDKVRRLKASRPQNKGGGGRMRGIFHQWLDGDNIIRLAGQFLEVRTHFIAPAPKRNDRGLCRADAFKGDGAIPMVVNCPDWDAVKEEAKPIKTCPLCKLAAIARAIKKEAGSTDEEKKFFDALAQAAAAKMNLKWNILDRTDPNILLVDDNGNEKKTLGFKIANIGTEAWNDIEGIFEQCKIDISDPVKGVDIKVNKGHNGKRVVYTAQAILEGTSLRVTPFTEEEAALQLHNLKELCGKATPAQRIVDALHEDLRELYEANLDTTHEDGVVGEAETPSVLVDEKTVIQEALDESTVALADADDDALCGVPNPAPAAAPARPATPRAAAPTAPRPAAPVVAPTAVPARPAAPKAVAPTAPAASAAPVAPAVTKPATAPIRRAIAVPGADAQKKRA